MWRRGIAMSLLGLVLATGLAAAQTPPGAPKKPSTPQPSTSTTQLAPTSSTAGAFDKLSPGNKQIARALFRAQTPTATSGTTTSQSAPTAKLTPLTLDQIAALKLSGQGWGEVFKQMKAQGLTQAKNLGQVVSQARTPRARAGASPTASPTGSGRPTGAGARGKPEGTASQGKDGQESGVGAAVTGGGQGYGVGPGAGGGRGR